MDKLAQATEKPKRSFIRLNEVISRTVRSMMNICLSFDHRIIDGAEASKFLQGVKLGLEAIDGASEFQ